MNQIPLENVFKSPYSEKMFIKFSGTDEQLLEHKIDAISYATSIKGYVVFTTKIIEAFLGHNVKISVVAHKEGSFGDIIDAVWQRKDEVGYAIAILDFCGVNLKTITKYSSRLLVALQNAFIKLIIENDGITELIVSKVNSSSELSHIEKEHLINFIKEDELRNSLDEFTSPLDKNGYNNIVVSNESNDEFKITSNQRQAFKYTPPDLTSEESFHEVVSVVYLSPELTKWQFQGSKTFWAEILDKDFLNETKDIAPSDLKGRFYSVIGTRIVVTNNGKIKGKPKYTVTKAIEVPRPLSLLP